MQEIMARLKAAQLNTSDGSMVEPLFLDIWAVDKFFEYNHHKGTIVPQLEAGDEIWLKKETQGYSHVLLYIGNSEVVHVSDVQKSGLSLGKTIICRDKLEDVAKDKLIGCRKTNGLSPEKRDEIVTRALKDVGKFFPYLLTTDNCEHQVKYWISGVKDYRWIVSTQASHYYFKYNEDKLSVTG
ncbi:HRAS-like suppressor 2 [Folsomia candida]|uniref:HRAS-like suppressor 2 n=1 Tax=Folsomia candida TaxID=158441 RepID=A0A226DF16_FOLCA|nr:HRAS-like suppressor 2 [Folsomia candida]